MTSHYEISESFRQRIFENRWFYDCAVVDRDTVSFILFDNGPEDNGNRALGTVSFGADAKLGGKKFNGFAFPMLGVAPNLGKTSVMLGSIDGVAVHGEGGGEMWPDIPKSPQGPISTGPTNVATIGGKLYVCAGWRHVCYLSDAREWVSIRHNLPDPPNPKKASRFGFEAIAGFGADDIYAAGGEGDLWHFDGKTWRQCQVPTNMTMESLAARAMAMCTSDCSPAA
ncbi:hypothetical protein ACQ86G_22805 [Roseateles chitinivorans]|uniref:hypothetical protein n=1 Tax=Roseateles chitinivorans TaxID=2917965 RepID=UPI003D666EED